MQLFASNLTVTSAKLHGSSVSEPVFCNNTKSKWLKKQTNVPFEGYYSVIRLQTFRTLYSMMLFCFVWMLCSIHISTSFHLPSRGQSENWSLRQLNYVSALYSVLSFAVQLALLLSRGFLFFVFYYKETCQDWVLGWGYSQNCDVTYCFLSWETHPSNRHLWFCVGSLWKEAACLSLGILKCQSVVGLLVWRRFISFQKPSGMLPNTGTSTARSLHIMTPNSLCSEM